MDKVVDFASRLNMVKLDKSRDKKCKCKNRRYVIDTENRAVECEECGVVFDPFDVLLDIVARYDYWSTETQRIIDERKAVERYRSRNPVLNRLFRTLREADDNNLVPVCPHCQKPFDLSILTHFINRAFMK